jgi:hypothetical protein
MLSRLLRNETPTPVDALIAKVLLKMDDTPPDSDEYKTLLNRLERLYELKTQSRPPRVSRDTLWLVAGNLLGIAVIVIYEQSGHAMTSKGFTQVIRPKLK